MFQNASMAYGNCAKRHGFLPSKMEIPKISVFYFMKNKTLACGKCPQDRCLPFYFINCYNGL
ncbi:MAG: hypothetical protein EOO35_00390 [Cyanobacteriota bacterium]|nr:MAG: hypothetical protein EOO35_00390 [Cyanobacteriota bacterium]